MSVLKCLTWTTRLDKILEKVHSGDLVRFHRGLFIHHAVYVGLGRAVHHHLGPGVGEVIEATMEYLAKGDLMKVVKAVDTGTSFSPREIVRRARSQIGPRPYSLHDGNCEHFTTWVYHGVEASSQLSGLCKYELSLLRIVTHTQTPGGLQEQQPQAPQQPETQQQSQKQQQQHHTMQQKPQTLQQPQTQQTSVTQQKPQMQQQQQTLQQPETQQQPHMYQQPETQRQTDMQQQPKTQQQPQQMVQQTTCIDTTSNNTESKEDSDSGAEDDDFVFIPPRPIKYRHTKNPARIACNHASSCLKVLAVQIILGLAAVPLYRCSLQADNLQKLGQQLMRRRRRRQEQRLQQQQNQQSDEK